MAVKGYSNFPDGNPDLSSINSAISSLQSDMSEAQGDIEQLETDLGTANGKITTIEGQISTLQEVTTNGVRYKGSVENYAALTALTATAKTGDMYNDRSTDMNYVFTADSTWDPTSKLLDESKFAKAEDLETANGKISDLEGQVEDLEDSIGDLETATEGGMRYKGEITGASDLTSKTGDAVKGDLYFDTTNLEAHVFDGTVFKKISKVVDPSAFASASEFATYKDTVDGLVTDNTQNKSDIGQLKTDVAGLKSADTAIEGRLDTLEADNTSNKGKIEALETDNTKNKQDIADLQGADTAIKGRIDVLEGDNTTNKGKISALEGDNTTNKADIASLQSSVEEIEGKLGDIEDIGQELEDINDAIDAVKAEVVVLHDGTYTIQASSWTGDAKPWKNTVSVTGLGANDVFHLAYTPSEKALYQAAQLDLGDVQSEGSFEVISNADTKPTSNLTGSISWFTKGID